MNVAGQGPDLILIHGASGNLREFDDLTAALARDFRVIALDRPGLGHSEGLDLSDVGLKAQAQHLSEAAAELGVQRPLILGHSYGGSVALAWALAGHLRPSGLALISSPSLPWPGNLDAWYRLTDTGFGQTHAIPAVSALLPEFYLRRMATGVFHPEPAPEGYFEAKAIPLAIRRETLRHNTAQVNRLLSDIRAQKDRYPTLHLPVELVHGTEDPIVPIQIHSRPLSRLLPDARLTELPGAGHMPHLTRQPDILAAVHRLAERAALRPAP